MADAGRAEWSLDHEAAALYEAGRRAYDHGSSATEPDVATVAWTLSVERLERAVELYRKLSEDSHDTDGLSASLLCCGLALGRLGLTTRAVECLEEAAALVAAADAARVTAPPRGRLRGWRRLLMGP